MASSEPAGQSRQTGLTHTAKSLLRNVIKHTDTHNRLKEESEMWTQFYKIRGIEPAEGEERQDGRQSNSRHSHDRDGRDGSRRRGDLDIQQSFLYDEREDMRGDWRRRGHRQAHMDDTRGGGGPSGERSTYWMRQLHKAEDGDPDRWGHGGFKELYPEDYNSDRSKSSSTSPRNERRKDRKRERKKESSDRKDKKKKRKSKEKKRKKKKKKERKRGSEGGGSDEEEAMHRKRKRRRSRDDSSDRKRKKKEVEVKAEKSARKERELSVGSEDSVSEDNDSEGDLSGGGREGRRSWRYEGENGKRKRGAERESPQRRRRRRKE